MNAIEQLGEIVDHARMQNKEIISIGVSYCIKRDKQISDMINSLINGGEISMGNAIGLIEGVCISQRLIDVDHLFFGFDLWSKIRTAYYVEADSHGNNPYPGELLSSFDGIPIDMIDLLKPMQMVMRFKNGRFLSFNVKD